MRPAKLLVRVAEPVSVESVEMVVIDWFEDNVLLALDQTPGEDSSLYAPLLDAAKTGMMRCGYMAVFDSAGEGESLAWIELCPGPWVISRLPAGSKDPNPTISLLALI
jgi:hypothetical protein